MNKRESKIQSVVNWSVNWFSTNKIWRLIGGSCAIILLQISLLALYTFWSDKGLSANPALDWSVAVIIPIADWYLIMKLIKSA